MKSKTSLIAVPFALLVTACGGGGGVEELPPAPVQDGGASYGPPPMVEEGGPPPAEGPQGSSRLRPGEDRYDRVGYAGYAGAGQGTFALSGVLPAGSFAEVTALDSGRTILVQVRGQGRGLLELSGDAARQLGVTGNPPVRVRRVTVTGQDASLLSAGQAAPPRADAPPALLAGLRRRLGDRTETPPAATPPPRTPTRPAAAPAAPSRATRGLFVQVAALSSAQRARALADELGGIVRSAGNVHRVQIGPFTSQAAADRARADVARRGFGDARIVSVP